MVSQYAVENEIRTGVLARVPIENWQLWRSMNLVYRAQKYFSPAGDRFLEFIRSYAAEHLEPVERIARNADKRRKRPPP
jgi:DNA-binding transcriptional LysR family regulator